MKSIYSNHQNTPQEQEGWQLTAEEIADIERINAEEMQKVAFDGHLKTTFKIRVQQISLIEIEVEANSAEAAETKALKTLENMPEAGEVLRCDFGHRTIEIVNG